MFDHLRKLFVTETIEGYEHPELVDVIYHKTRLYDPVFRKWPEFSGAQTVLDFGGGCGIHYKQAQSATVRWAIVETPAMIAKAVDIQTDLLRFFADVQDAASWLGSVDLMHSDGAVQYTPEPLATVRSLCGVGAKTLLWRRCAFSETPSRVNQISNLLDNGPGNLLRPDKKVSYKLTTIAEADFLAAHRDYKLVDRGKDWFRFKA